MRGNPRGKTRRKGLNKIADTLGRHRQAREIEPDEVVELLRPIYDRGKRSMADHVRSYIRSAYSWGMKSEHDYRTASPRRFRLAYNPAASIPTEPKVRGTRWLDEDEFVATLQVARMPGRAGTPLPYLRAVRVLMLTGQRVEEMAQLHVDQWDADGRILDWSKTKNGKPHSLPVLDLAADLLESIKAKRTRLVFPVGDGPDEARLGRHPLCLHVAAARPRRDTPSSPIETCGGRGRRSRARPAYSKEIRDRLQNHTLQDVSSKHYDRWQYMPEKREGMNKWNGFVTALLASKERKMAAQFLRSAGSSRRALRE